MLVTLKEVLKVAEEKEIAIGAFNAPNLESLQAVMAAAEEMDLPVIIQFAPVREQVPMMRLRFTPIRYRQKISSQEPALTHWHAPSEPPMVFI